MKNNITMHFGGGSLYLKCHKCNKEIGSEEVAFPGTPEQQKTPRLILAEVAKHHNC